MNPEDSYSYGQQYMKIGTESGYKNAAWNFRKAVIGNRYLMFFKNHKELPGYYFCLGNALLNLNRYEEAHQALLEALEMYKKYNPDKADEMALTKVLLEFTGACLGENEEVIQYGMEAVDYYSDVEHTDYGVSAAGSYLFLAAAYYNLKEYETALPYFEIGLPMYYELIDWGINDDTPVNMIAVMYKMAEECAAKIGDTTKEAYYKEEYEEFVWLHDVVVSDLIPLIDGFHWNLKME